LNAYWNRIDDKIQLVPRASGGGNVFAGAGRVEIIGSEAEARYFIDPNKSLFGNLTANQARDLENHRNTGGIAPVQGNFGTDLLFRGKLGVSLRGPAVARRRT